MLIFHGEVARSGGKKMGLDALSSGCHPQNANGRIPKISNYVTRWLETETKLSRWLLHLRTKRMKLAPNNRRIREGGDRRQMSAALNLAEAAAARWMHSIRNLPCILCSVPPRQWLKSRTAVPSTRIHRCSQPPVQLWCQFHSWSPISNRSINLDLKFQTCSPLDLRTVAVVRP